MVKWADYLISQVSYDSNHLIARVKQHKDNGNKISEGEVVDRSIVTGNLGHGTKYMTVFGDLGKIRMGKNIRYLETPNPGKKCTSMAPPRNSRRVKVTPMEKGNHKMLP